MKNGLEGIKSGPGDLRQEADVLVYAKDDNDLVGMVIMGMDKSRRIGGIFRM